MTRVSVIVPCCNERDCLDAFLKSVFAQVPASPEHVLEVVIADGMSDDGTRERLQDWQRRQPALVVIDNPERITSTALNRAIERATGEIVVRMDVHTVYASDYVAECVRTLERTGATCVGGPWRPVGEGALQGAIARAFESRFGSGGAASRRTDYSGPVDTVYLGAWRRADLVRLGGFDEFLVRNQDDELNLRIVRSGGKVWQSVSIRSYYAPRASLRALFRQFYQYGYWKIPVIRKHRLPASPRHLVPFAFVLVLTLLAAAALFWPPAGLAGLALLATYFVAALANAAGSSRLLANPWETLTIAMAFACMHFGYGIGFGHGLLDFVVLSKRPHNAMTRLTR
ncbi:MAG: glycosyltransferase family 2 protein [Burkholderiaceae bacterium]|nr:glycosyltransferase family 2 protein [Burkholderiaceae bacterium]